MRDLIRDAVYQRGHYDPNRKPTVEELRARRDALVRGELEAQERAALEVEIERLKTRAQGPASAEDERVETTRADAEPVTAGSPLSRQRHHENEILRVLAELGHDTKALPKWGPTKPGGKQEARAKLPRMTKKTFDKAWERLSSSGDIAYAE